MSISIQCLRCETELEQQGALLFSPPDNERTVKYHLCRQCYIDLMVWLMWPKVSEAE